MTDDALTLSLELPLAGAERPHMRRSIRRLSNFSRTVEFGLGQFNRRYGVELKLDRHKLASAFLEWARRFDAQRQLADRNRRDFSHFAAGLMFASLIRNRPVAVAESDFPSSGRGDPSDALVEFWPEGVFYFEFCITVLDRVLAEQSLEGIELVPEAMMLRAWHSFRENVSEDPNLAVPFLDLFLGGDPVWEFPTAARFRDALREQLLQEPPRAKPLM